MIGWVEPICGEKGAQFAYFECEFLPRPVSLEWTIEYMKKGGERPNISHVPTEVWDFIGITSLILRRTMYYISYLGFVLYCLIDKYRVKEFE